MLDHDTLFAGTKTCDVPGCDATATRGGTTSDGSRYLWTCGLDHARSLDAHHTAIHPSNETQENIT